MRFAYPVEIVEDGDGFTVTCPDVPEMVTDGGTRAEALARASDALIPPCPSMSTMDARCRVRRLRSAGRSLPFPRWRPRNSRFTMRCSPTVSRMSNWRANWGPTKRASGACAIRCTEAGSTPSKPP